MKYIKRELDMMCSVKVSPSQLCVYWFASNRSVEIVVNDDEIFFILFCDQGHIDARKRRRRKNYMNGRKFN